MYICRTRHYTINNIIVLFLFDYLLFQCSYRQNVKSTNLRRHKNIRPDHNNRCKTVKYKKIALRQNCFLRFILSVLGINLDFIIVIVVIERKQTLCIIIKV